MSGQTLRWEDEACCKLPSIPGVYVLWFEGDLRAYIGQSSNIRKRVRTHLYEMQAFRDHKMRDDFNSHGAAALRAAVLETVHDLTALSTQETYWMNKYRAGGWSLYNVEKAGKAHRDRGVIR